MRLMLLALMLVGFLAKADNVHVWGYKTGVSYAGKKTYILSVYSGYYSINGIVYTASRDLNNKNNPYLVINGLSRFCLDRIKSGGFASFDNVTTKLLTNLINPPSPDAYYSYTFNANGCK